ncbi:MAG: hypothetical protein CK424_02265 [Legionella sp.]|nr:MAG: hypothetical protein CK424_02265 [Legionella sp.]
MKMKFLKFLTGMFYLAIPVLGWYALYRSIKQVKPGEISVVNTWSTAEVLTPGIYFYPFPWESFGATVSNTLNYINFGSLIRVRVLPGQVGVKMTTTNTYKILPPGEYIIKPSLGELFDPFTGFQNPSSASFTLGTETTVTITEGQVAVIDTPEGIKIINTPGKHKFNKSNNEALREIINTGSQVLTLPSLTVQCTDRINMRAEAMLTYKVIEPGKTLSLGMPTIIGNLQKLGDAALRTILSQHSSTDIAPSPHNTEFHDGKERISALKEIHDQFLKDLDAKAQEWGIKISDLVITEILPSDLEYQKTIQSLGVKQATAEAQKSLEETQAAVAAIKAKAEQSRIIAAGKEQEEAMIRAKTEVDTLLLGAEAQKKATLLEAEGDAGRIEIIAKAKAAELNLLNAATKDATELTKVLSVLKAQGDIVENIKTPVFIPQPEIGSMRHFSGPNGNHTLFASGANGDNTALNDILTLQTVQAADRIASRSNP